MEAQNLRLGNYINYAYFPNVKDSIEMVVISGITETHITYKEVGKEFTYQLLDFKPIPLTEEWLLKLGLKVTDDEDSFEISVSINKRHSVINVSWEPDISVDIYTTNPDEERGSWLNTNVKHVHQLQNLYFSITGEELKL